MELGQDMATSVHFKMVPAFYTALDWKHDGKVEHTRKRKDGTQISTTTFKFTGRESCEHVFRGFDVESNFTRTLVHKNGTETQRETVEVKKKLFCKLCNVIEELPLALRY